MCRVCKEPDRINCLILGTMYAMTTDCNGGAAKKGIRSEYDYSVWKERI